METVELKGLRYDPSLQDEAATAPTLLSATLKTKVGSPWSLDPVLCLLVRSLHVYQGLESTPTLTQ